MCSARIALIILLSAGGSITFSRSEADIKYVGCFDPLFSLNKDYHNHVSPFTWNACLATCRTKGSRYMGLKQRDGSCFCGNYIPEHSQRYSNGFCNISCVGDGAATHNTCGGNRQVSVYDLGKTVPPRSVSDERGVSFLVTSTSGVRMINTAVENSYTVIANDLSSGYSLDYHLERNLVYVFSFGKLFKGTLDPKSPKSAPPTFVRRLSYCEGFAVDWIHDVIYWVDCSTNSLKIMDLDGNNETTLIKLGGGWINVNRIGVDPEVGKVFWLADGTLGWADSTGKNLPTNLSEPGEQVIDFTLDISSRRVFYLGTDTLYEISYSSIGTLVSTQHVSFPQSRTVHSLCVLGHYLYWTHIVNHRQAIYRQPLNMSGQPEVLRNVPDVVWCMRVIDAELQALSSGDPCRQTKCSHFCVHQAGVAKCVCPDGMRLVENTTCSDEVFPLLRSPGRGGKVHVSGRYEAYREHMFRKVVFWGLLTLLVFMVLVCIVVT